MPGKIDVRWSREFLRCYCVTFKVSGFGVLTGVPLAPFAEIVTA
jgi:hypothetical protein